MTILQMSLQMPTPPHNIPIPNPSLKTSLTRFLLMMRILNPLLHRLTLTFIPNLTNIAIGIDIIRSFDELHRQPTLNMPHDMAMHQPRAWIIGLESDDGVAERSTGATTTKHHGITTDGIDEVETAHVRECAEAFTEDGHVVAV